MKDDLPKSPYFHSNFKGCEVKWFAGYTWEEVLLKDGTCLTHKVQVCRCGWESRKHYDVLEATRRLKHKLCLRCRLLFRKRPKTTFLKFERQKYCSVACRYART